MWPTTINNFMQTQKGISQTKLYYKRTSKTPVVAMGLKNLSVTHRPTVTDSGGRGWVVIRGTDRKV